MSEQTLTCVDGEVSQGEQSRHFGGVEICTQNVAVDRDAFHSGCKSTKMGAPIVQISYTRKKRDATFDSKVRW